MPKTVPCLWFDRNGMEAAELYCSIFPNSRITLVTHYPDGERAGEVLTIDFELDGQRYQILNGGPEFTFDEAISFVIEVADQAELDRYWEKLTADGGEEGPCGWCKDRFGLSWQVVPADWADLLKEPERAARAMQAMYGMKKIDIAAMKAAADGA